MLTRGGCRVSGGDMDIARALLDAIRDDPDDDLPRLAYADWLMEQPSETDQARGEFIQLQCRLARAEADDPALDETRRREAELLGEHRAAWLGELVQVGECQLIRGFVRLTITADSWQSLRQVNRLSEWKQAVGLRVKQVVRHRLLKLAAWPGLADIPDLDLEAVRYDRMPVASFEQLFGVAKLARWSCLRLSGDLIQYVGLRQLMETPLPSRLVRLAIENDTLADEGLDLFTPDRFPRLRDLSFFNNSLNAEAVETIAQLPNLRRLCLARNLIGPPGARFLASSSQPHLEDLDLSHNHLRDAGARALLNAPFLPHLRRLRLEGNAIIDEEICRRYREILGTRVEL